MAAANSNANFNADQPVYIVVYSPHTDQETVHATEYPQGSGNYCLLGFESLVECQDFADIITVGQPGSVDPEPTQYTLEQMDQYCQEMNWPFFLVPEESMSSWNDL